VILLASTPACSTIVGDRLAERFDSAALPGARRGQSHETLAVRSAIVRRLAAFCAVFLTEALMLSINRGGHGCGAGRTAFGEGHCKLAFPDNSRSRHEAALSIIICRSALHVVLFCLAADTANRLFGILRPAFVNPSAPRMWAQVMQSEQQRRMTAGVRGMGPPANNCS